MATRVGLLALWVFYFADHLLTAYPLTLDFSSWYAGRSFVVLAIVAGLALYAFRLSLGGKPAFAATRLEQA